jgi:C1A family cysteine protease
MKKVVKALSLGVTVSCLLGAIPVHAQSRTDFGRLNPRLPDLGRRLPNRPLPPMKTQNLTVKGENIQKEEKEFQQNLRLAVAYLKKNPKEVGQVSNPRAFAKIAYLVEKGEFEKLASLDNPIVKYPRGAGEDQKVLFTGAVTNLADLGGALADGNDEQNIKSVYEKAFKLLHPNRRRTFKNPKDVYKLPKKEAKVYLAKVLEVIGHYTFIPYEPTSPGWKWDCDDEIGQQRVGTGDAANRCEKDEFHPDSLFTHSNTTDFPLKYYHTCIKSQGSRGTCVSFAINAAVESALMVKEDKAYNLSEQYTYLYGEIYANHSGRYSYGLPTGKAVKKMDSKNVKFQYERYWEYNPSSDIGNKSGNSYPSSCVGYNGEMCTNFAFQGQESITGFWPFKNYNYTVPYRGTSKNIQVIDRSNIWMSWAKGASLDLAISLTKAKVPLVLSFTVKQNFMDTGSDGYVYYKSGEDSVGGHASVILGFVPNNKLPAGVSPAKEKGFFIVKNSWGTWNGDCGYYYVDYKYLKKFAKGIYTVTVN